MHCSSFYDRGNSSRKVSNEWLDTQETDGTDYRNNAPSTKTITAANNQNNYSFTKNATLQTVSSPQKIK